MKIAIDPGSSSGALAVRTEGGGVELYNMPETAKDIFTLLEELFSRAIHKGKIEVIIEDVGAGRPGNSARSMHTFAVHQGHLEMACLALSLPVTKVRPQKWMKALFGSTLPHGTDNMAARKTAIYDAVQRWYPGVKVTKRQADALAILRWAEERSKQP